MEVKIEEAWKTRLQDEFTKDYFITLTDFVRNEYRQETIYPPGSMIFNAFNLCSFNNIKVVIIGQDPYHGPGQAHGLCFSVKEGVAFPPSLLNIYKELQADLGIARPSSGNLERWEEFTDSVISLINREKNNIVFFLWGAYAQKKGESIDRNRHLVLESVHPSPLSASRGFFGNKHFSKCNDYLISNNIQPIDWQ
jgi:uracil-DNA glycosylase